MAAQYRCHKCSLITCQHHLQIGNKRLNCSFLKEKEAQNKKEKDGKGPDESWEIKVKIVWGNFHASGRLPC